MKDYRLSEILKICNENKACGKDCSDCDVGDFCYSDLKVRNMDLDIEPRDMIELPCKIPMIAINEQVLSWQVAYRSVLGTGDIRTRLFYTEPEADAFLEELKGEKQ